MFKKSDFEGKEIKAFFGEGINFKGVLRFNGTVRIDGYLEGEIITNDTLIVGDKAHIVAELSVGTLISLGKIEGNIVASKKIEIRAKSEIIGNVKTPVIFIDEGATFEGQCEMIKKGGYKEIIEEGAEQKIISITNSGSSDKEVDKVPA